MQLIDHEQTERAPRYKLLEPLIEGIHGEASARRYLAEFNFINGTKFELEEFVSTVIDGEQKWVFHIAGERRLRAGDMIIERDGLSPDSIFQCSVKYDPTYIDALPEQFVENNARVNPLPQDEARAIRKYYDAMKQLAANAGKRYTNVECARAFAVNPNKIADAITFTDYPASMQALVEEYPFSMVVDAKELFEAWKIYHADTDEELGPDQQQDFIATTGRNGFATLEGVAAFEVETCFTLIKAERAKRRTDPHAKRRDVSIKKQTENVLASVKQRGLGFAQGILDIPGDPNNYWTRRKLAAEQLFRDSFNNHLYLERMSMLSGEMKRRLGQLAGVGSVMPDDSAAFREFEEAFAS
ncbi:MAG: hypothetical protein WAQ25_02465 [Candidatus Saccharimonas sp.]